MIIPQRDTLDNASPCYSPPRCRVQFGQQSLELAREQLVVCLEARQLVSIAPNPSHINVSPGIALHETEVQKGPAD